MSCCEIVEDGREEYLIDEIGRCEKIANDCLTIGSCLIFFLCFSLFPDSILSSGIAILRGSLLALYSRHG
jgi:hypothetical protein